jgi:hypothetical protein
LSVEPDTLLETNMADNNVTLSSEQVSDIFKALDGISNLITNVVSKPGNAAEVYAIMSNIAVIQTHLTGMPRAHPN